MSEFGGDGCCIMISEFVQLDTRIKAIKTPSPMPTILTRVIEDRITPSTYLAKSYPIDLSSRSQRNDPTKTKKRAGDRTYRPIFHI
jgi:hypothetical protein